MENIRKMIVTPSMAKEFLSKNTSNRRVRDQIVNYYADQMVKGKWNENTFEFIKISPLGRILDGQHRLLAVVKANIPITLQLAFNVPDSVFGVIDAGLKRNNSDAFKIEGIKNECRIPAMITYYNDLKNGLTTNTVNRASRNLKLSAQDVLDIYNQNPEYWQFVHKQVASYYISFSKVLPISFLGGFFAYIDEKHNQEVVESFLNQLCNGMNIQNETISLLRNRLFSDKLSQKRMVSTVKNALIFKTFNAFLNNKVLKVLKVDLKNEQITI